MSAARNEGLPENSILTVALAALVGSSIEWYDFFIYGTAAALVFPTLFFPANLPPAVSQAAAFSTFAVGFVARPLGGAAFGHFGDRVGRKQALVAALVIMGLATAMIGLLPSYRTAGIAAPIGLVVLRFVQGVAVGGQWGGAVLLATESAPAGRRGFYGSFAQVGVPVGVVLANLGFLMASSRLPPAALQAWGWRAPFLLSLLLVALGLYLQVKLEDTAAFRRLQVAQTVRDEAEVSPLLSAIRRRPRQILLAGGAFVASNGCFYIYITYVIAYGTTALGAPRDQILSAVLIASALMIPALPAAAALSDRLGRRRVFMAGAALSGLWALAFFPLLGVASLAAVIAAVAVALVLLSLMYGPQAALFAEIFPTEIRYSGASLGYQIGAIFGGGFAPIIATALVARFGDAQAVGLYMAALCAISFFCVARLTRGAGADVREGAPA